MNSQCRHVSRRPYETKLMQKYEDEEERVQETPRVSGLSRGGGVKALQGLRNI